MTQGEKVDVRDIALRWAKELYPIMTPEQRAEAEAFFPELKESEDERIKKDIITYLSTVEDKELIPYETWIAWIKKQGKRKSDTDFSDLRTWKYIVDAVLTEKDGIGQYLDDPFTEEVAKKLQKRFGNIEQKSTGKIQQSKSVTVDNVNEVEPHYNIGDVLYDKSCNTLNKGEQPNFKIVDIKDGVYICNSNIGFSYLIPIFQQDNYELVVKKLKTSPLK